MRITNQLDARHYLIGKRIVAVDLRSFSDGRGGVTYDPHLTLDDGSEVHAVVDETDVGEYGLTLVRRKA